MTKTSECSSLHRLLSGFNGSYSTIQPNRLGSRGSLLTSKRSQKRQKPEVWFAPNTESGHVGCFDAVAGLTTKIVVHILFGDQDGTPGRQTSRAVCKGSHNRSSRGVSGGLQAFMPRCRPLILKRVLSAPKRRVFAGDDVPVAVPKPNLNNAVPMGGEFCLALLPGQQRHAVSTSRWHVWEHDPGDCQFMVDAQGSPRCSPSTAGSGTKTVKSQLVPKRCRCSSAVM